METIYLIVIKKHMGSIKGETVKQATLAYHSAPENPEDLKEIISMLQSRLQDFEAAHPKRSATK